MSDNPEIMKDGKYIQYLDNFFTLDYAENLGCQLIELAQIAREMKKVASLVAHEFYRNSEGSTFVASKIGGRILLECVTTADHFSHCPGGCYESHEAGDLVKLVPES